MLYEIDQLRIIIQASQSWPGISQADMPFGGFEGYKNSLSP